MKTDIRRRLALGLSATPAHANRKRPGPTLYCRFIHAMLRRLQFLSLV